MDFFSFIKTKNNAKQNLAFMFFVSRRHNARAHLAWDATGPVCQTARNRLKIGAHRECIVSDDILETQRLPRTDG
jgi:hypothetical protein